MVEDRQQRLLRALWSFGKLSRWELHEQTGLTPNGVGTLADTLIRSKLVRELPPGTRLFPPGTVSTGIIKGGPSDGHRS